MSARRAALLLVPLGALLLAWEGPTPWPWGVAPTPVAVREQIEDALRVGRRERTEELIAALDPVEQSAAIDLPLSVLGGGAFDPDAIFIRGDAFFAHFFTEDEGFGGLVPGPGLRRVHAGRRGGLDSHACDGCHSVGGLDGAGTFAQSALLLGDGERASSAVVRNAPSLLGLGLVQALGVEMSAALDQQRQEALAQARREGAPVSVALSAKGVSFGTLRALPDGTLDTSGVQGVSPDLVVRPFGWKGDVARLRRFVEEAARVHFGVQTAPLEAQNRAQPDPERVGAPSADPDGDGHLREVEEGALSTTSAYLAMLETPVIAPPSDPALLRRWSAGDRLFTALGCEGCHVRSLTLETRIWEEEADTPGGPSLRFNLLLDGEEPRGTDRVTLFSDLRRHDLGPALADGADHPDGIPRAEFLTRPLWGLAETGPWLHDGRATTLPEAVLAHGGEASAARDAFAALPEERQRDLIVFLLSLSRQPKVRVAR